MAVTAANYGPFITTIDTTIGQVYERLKGTMTHERWTKKLTMAGSIWETGWIGRLAARPRPWYGSRRIVEVAPQTYQIIPIPYELTLAIDRFVQEDSDVNTTSIFWRMLPDLARAWVMQPEYELRDLLEATGIQGTAKIQLGLDGLTYWNTAHPINIYNPGFNGGGNALFAGGTYCNDFTGGGVTINGTLIGGPLSTTAFASLLQYVQVVPDESGEALGVMPTDIMIPSTLTVEASFILKATLLAAPQWGAFSPLTGQVGSADNQLAKMGVGIIVNPNLKNTKRWYLLDTASDKPTHTITREAPRTVPKLSETDDNMFNKHQMLWGGWDRVGFGWNFSWLMYRSGP